MKRVGSPARSRRLHASGAAGVRARRTRLQSGVRLVPVVLAALVLSACGMERDPEPPGVSAAKRARLVVIRDVAAERGMTNAALLAGIAESETHVAHCWSDATYACRGPDSPSCEGPVIAGSADGPCSEMQGGLGMFQFDAGTWSETLALYGEAVLTIEGNTAQAVSFVIAQVMREVDGVTDAASAIDWMNHVPLVAEDPVMATWARLLACRYNGCCADSALCASRADGYRDHAIELAEALGDAFWR